MSKKRTYMQKSRGPIYTTLPYRLRTLLTYKSKGSLTVVRKGSMMCRHRSGRSTFSKISKCRNRHEPPRLNK